MAFSSLDHLISKTTRGSAYRTDFTTGLMSAASIIGRWYDTSGYHRSYPANAYAGTSLTWTSCNETNGNGTQIFGLPHGRNVASETKHVINASAAISAGFGVCMLVDLQGYWPGINTNSSSQQNLSGTPTLRYSNGEGCQMYFVQTTAAGATPSNISVSYTNQSATSGRSLLSTVAMSPSATVGTISHSGIAANNCGVFLPLAAGDQGVQNVASVTLSSAMGAGAGALCIVKPILTIPLTTTYVMSERDMMSYFPSTPRIYDGACLIWLFFAHTTATAATTNLYGHLDFAWG
jgi:hypothetical protein